MAFIFTTFETFENKYMVDFNREILNKANKDNNFGDIQSYNIIPARILNTTYANYLRFARDRFNGTIYGKGKRVPIVKFDNKEDCNRLCMFLTRAAAGLITSSEQSY